MDSAADDLMTASIGRSPRNDTSGGSDPPGSRSGAQADFHGLPLDNATKPASTEAQLRQGLVVKSYNVDFCPPLAAAPRVTALSSVDRPPCTDDRGGAGARPRGRLSEAKREKLPAIENKSESYSKNNSRKGEADEGAYEGRRLCALRGLAAVQINGTDNINHSRRATSDEDRLHTYIRADERQRRETLTYAWTKGRARDMDICVDERLTRRQTIERCTSRKAAPSQHRQAAWTSMKEQKT